LIALSDEEFNHAKSELFSPMELPDVVIPTHADFGTLELKQRLFYLEPDWTFINHGAFGASMKPAMQVARAFSERCEAQPLRFVDRELLPRLVDSVRSVAEFVNCPPTELVLVPNVTTGLNAVFNSLSALNILKENDQVLQLDHVYGSVWKMLLNYFGAANIWEADVQLPARSSDITSLIESTISNSNGRIKLVVVDHVTSNSALVLPVADIVRVCHQHNVLCVVDGAHALGALDLNLATLDADFYVSNAHKWLCSPKGCAFLHVPARNQHLMRPFVVSHGSGKGFISDFIWTGMTDYGTMLALPYLLNLWKRIGVQTIRSYIHDLLSWAIEYLVEQWGTDLLGDRDMYGTMATIRLPGPRLALSADEHNDIQNTLHFQHRIEVISISSTMIVSTFLIFCGAVSRFRSSVSKMCCTCAYLHTFTTVKATTNIWLEPCWKFEVSKTIYFITLVHFFSTSLRLLAISISSGSLAHKCSNTSHRCCRVA
jgi:selenocysteine lyase/cysteine desulfurase